MILAAMGEVVISLAVAWVINGDKLFPVKDEFMEEIGGSY